MLVAIFACVLPAMGFSLTPANLIYVYQYGPPQFAVGAIEEPRDLFSIALRLQTKHWPSGRTDLVSVFLYSKLDDNTRSVLEEFTRKCEGVADVFSKVGSNQLKQIATDTRMEELLVANLNKIIQGKCIYEQRRFQDVQLRRATKNLRMQMPAEGPDLLRLNWLLIQDAYLELSRGVITGSGNITGFLARRGSISRIEILPTKLSSAEMQDIWIQVSTNKITLSDISKGNMKVTGTSGVFFTFAGGSLLRFRGEVFDGSELTNAAPVVLGSISKNSSLRLPCSVQDFANVFGKPDEVTKKHMW